MKDGYHDHDGIPAGPVFITPLVIKDLQKRYEAGLKEYGKPLHAHNGRNALQDLYEELLDAVMYLRQHLEEDV